MEARTRKVQSASKLLKQRDAALRKVAMASHKKYNNPFQTIVDAKYTAGLPNGTVIKVKSEKIVLESTPVTSQKQKIDKESDVKKQESPTKKVQDSQVSPVWCSELLGT